MPDSRVGDWFPVGARLDSPNLRLFCFPHGGGDASAFREWQALFGPKIEVVPAVLPGRERRIAEPLVASIEELTQQLAKPVRARAGDLDYALFGHSMGALIGFELSHALLAAGRPPRVLIVSGAQPPHLRPDGPVMHRLPDDEFISYVSTLEGTPAGVLDHPGLLDMLLPVLRADFEACETYTFRERPPLPIPIVVLGGTHDPRVPVGDLGRWQEVSSKPTEVQVYPGGHFFLFERIEEVIAVVAEHLTHGNQPSLR